MGSSSAIVTATRDVVLFAFDGIQRTDENQIPTITGGGDAILISGAGAVVNLVGGKNAILLAFDAASDSTVTASEFAIVMTSGTGNNLTVSGNEGAVAWTYGNFTGSVTSSAGSAIVSSIGNASNATIHGKEDSIAVTVGSFSGTVTSDDGYAGIISLLNATGTLNAGKGAVVLSDGSVNLTATADEDLFIWARGDVHGSYSAGRDAAVVSHGSYDASLTADNDIVFAYARTALHGSLTAGRWIGDGDTSVPMDPTEIDDVFSHGDIMAQLLAGTSVSNDADKGRIGTIGSIGNAGGTYSGKSIVRIRTGGTVTATYTTTGDFDNGTSTPPGSPVILQNQTSLITDVPIPTLDPSSRSQIVADAVADRAQAVADRDETVTAIADERNTIQTEKQRELSDLAEIQSDVRTETDAIQAAVDTAVNLAQSATEIFLNGVRWLIEMQYRGREASYLQEKTRFERQRDQGLTDIATAKQDAINSLNKTLDDFTQAGGFDEQIREARTVAILNGAYEGLYYKGAFATMRRELLADQEAGEAAWWNGTLDNWQAGIGIAGTLPVIGIVFDAGNVIISLGRRNFGEAAFNAACAAPVVGVVVQGARLAAKAAKVGKGAEVASTALSVAKNGEKAKDILKAGREAGGELYDDVDFLLKEMDDLKSPKDLPGLDAVKHIDDDILFNKHLEDLVDSHHGTPREVIEKAFEKYKVDPKLIMGKAGQPNVVDVAREMHKLGHAGKLNELPKYNEEFFRRLDAINKAAGKVTADDIWRVRDEMLRLYFGIGS